MFARNFSAASLLQRQSPSPTITRTHQWLVWLPGGILSFGIGRFFARTAADMLIGEEKLRAGGDRSANAADIFTSCYFRRPSFLVSVSPALATG